MKLAASPLCGLLILSSFAVHAQTPEEDPDAPGTPGATRDAGARDPSTAEPAPADPAARRTDEAEVRSPGADPAARDEMMRRAMPYGRGFAEITGAWGVQFGMTPYLPTGPGNEFRHPFVTGFGVGATGGLGIAEGVYLVVNYEYTTARSRSGDIDNAAERIRGFVDFHSLVGGLRLARVLGPGRLFGEIAFGAVFPFSTRQEIDYAAPLGAAGIMGTGVRRSHYNTAFGGHGLLGYAIDFYDRFYVQGGIKLRTFQSNNEGRTTELENFVTDFAAQPAPSVTNATIQHGDGQAQPTTNSVQDFRFQLAIGATF